MRRASLILLQAFIAASVSAQSVYDDEGRTLYAREMYGGPIIHGDGWGGQFWYGQIPHGGDTAPASVSRSWG
jgi:hypothetical protein